MQCWNLLWLQKMPLCKMPSISSASWWKRMFEVLSVLVVDHYQKLVGSVALVDLLLNKSTTKVSTSWIKTCFCKTIA